MSTKAANAKNKRKRDTAIASSQDDEDGDSGVRHDPGQNTNERREIRQNYRKIMAENEANKSELKRPGNAKLLTSLDKINQNFNQVKMTREAALDAEAIVKLARYAQQQAQQMNTSFVATTPAVLQDKLLAFLVGNHSEVDNDKWSSLGELALTHGSSKIVPTVEFMNGPLEMDVKKKDRKITVREKIDESVAIKPQVNQDDKLAGQGDVNRVEDTVWDILQDMRNPQHELNERSQGGIIPVHELVTNPQSFAQSVENLFGLAGLVGKGKAAVKAFKTSEEGEEDQIDFNCWAYEEADAQDENFSSVDSDDAINSMVCEYTFKEWRDNIEEYEVNADNQLIPHRDYSKIGNLADLTRI